VQQTEALVDHFVGGHEQRLRNYEPECLGCFAARERVSDYLDREYRRLAEAREARRRRPGRVPPMPVPDQAAVASLLARYSAVHGVDQALVRAVASVESGWNQQARSGAGAIGVMQLMPGTARELGVDPENVEQNIEGGIRYLAWLLRWFGNVEAALVAYNAGPGFAQRCLRGEAAVYGETRDFVRRVLAAAGR
jgi:soluble lytic murein transglycosylase-like protein